MATAEIAAGMCRGEEDVTRRPVRGHEHPTDGRTDNGSDASDAKSGAHAGRANVGWVERARERVEPRLASDDAPAGNEDDDVEQGERNARLADQRYARSRPGRMSCS